jgi:hypothetical protein
MNQIGLSPKVSVPTLALIVVGVILLIAGDKNTAVTLLLAAAGVGGVGYAVPHANVGEPAHVGEGSDALLSDAVKAEINPPPVSKPKAQSRSSSTRPRKK